VLAQVQHGGGWNPRPSALRRLGWELGRRTSIETASTPVPVRLAEPGLHRFPWLYLAGAGALPPFSEPARAALRRHLQYGGFLVVDSADGAEGGPSTRPFGGSSRRCSRRRSRRCARSRAEQELLPARSPGRRVLVKPWIEAQSLDGRLAVVYSQNDLGGAWARTELGDWEYPCTPGGEAQRETAFRLGVNLAMYALCTDYKDDAVHLPFILRRRS
jgi:hypothetical protein